MVLVTGSKFFGGPAFSGALLVPSSLAHARDGRAMVAPGLRDYASRSDWPMRWSALRSQFESRANLGQWLRWEAALEEIGAYYQVPAAYRAMALRELRAGIENLIALSPSLRLIGRETRAAETGDEEFCEPTIFPFTVGGRYVSFSSHECRTLHGALAQDLSHVLRCSDADREIVARRCLLGQPVRVERSEGRPIAVLRLCVGARQIIETWSPSADVARRNLERELDCIAEVIAKIELLLACAGERGLAEVSNGI
jgi:hypothetical protein